MRREVTERNAKSRFSSRKPLGEEAVLASLGMTVMGRYCGNCGACWLGHLIVKHVLLGHLKVAATGE